MTNRCNIVYCLVLGSVFSWVAPASAQTATTGAVRGVVNDTSTREPTAGATVVATSPALQGTEAQITDETGEFFFGTLPPGVYQLAVYYGEASWVRRNVAVSLGAVRQVDFRIDSSQAGGETIVIEASSPIVDVGSTKSGVVIGEDYTRRVPTGRTFIGALDAASDSIADHHGVAFAGTTSPENIYVVEGVNTTDPGFGLATSDLPNEFIVETEVVTGGYQAEYGRATGGLINVVTKAGGNDTHGSVFAYVTPGALSPEARTVAREGSSLTRRDELTVLGSIGAELGGPIIRDKLWYHVGINPVYGSTKIARGIHTMIDENDDGFADVDPGTGFALTREVSSQQREHVAKRLFYHAKLSFAADQSHRGALSLFGNPGTRTEHDPWVDMRGPEEFTMLEIEDGAYDTAGKWTSEFDNNATRLDVTAGYHRSHDRDLPLFDSGYGEQIRYDYARPLGDFAAYETVPSACNDSGDDPYPNIVNCPVVGYNTGGIGYRVEQASTRATGAVKLTQRVRFAGRHEFRLGADFELNTYSPLLSMTGGERLWHQGDIIYGFRLFTPESGGAVPCGADLDGNGTGDASCSFRERIRPRTETRNAAAFVQDSWAPMPNLTFNAGLRWEQQTLYGSEHVVGQLSPTSGRPISHEAFTLRNMLAPRVGVIYDWTNEGRSRVFGHYGRYYESIPLDINARGFGGEVMEVSVVVPELCADPTDPASCDLNGGETVWAGYFGGGETLAPKDLRAQYVDEYLGGVEYEVLADVKVGASLVHRSLGRAIEDISPDGGATYVIANPGESFADEVASLRAEAERLRAAGDAAGAQFEEFKADTFERIEDFDKPVRTYDALQIAASKRFSRRLMARGSYTFSRTQGNFPGLYSPDNAQLDPNYTTMYDLPELMANRKGRLPHDRPHLVKVDGYYTHPLNSAGWVVVGAVARAISGRPISAHGTHLAYGPDETFILQRGTWGRTDLFTQIDLRLTYGRKLRANTTLEAFFDVFNLFNQQATLTVDESYTSDPVNPIVGGSQEDLVHLKALDWGTGLPTRSVVARNPNYGNALSYQAPLAVRVGARLTF